MWILFWKSLAFPLDKLLHFHVPGQNVAEDNFLGTLTPLIGSLLLQRNAIFVNFVFLVLFRPFFCLGSFYHWFEISQGLDTVLKMRKLQVSSNFSPGSEQFVCINKRDKLPKMINFWEIFKIPRWNFSTKSLRNRSNFVPYPKILYFLEGLKCLLNIFLGLSNLSV